MGRGCRPYERSWEEGDGDAHPGRRHGAYGRPPSARWPRKPFPRQLPATRARPVLMPLELAGAIGYPLSDGAVAAEWGSLTMKAEEPITIGSLLGLLLLVFLPAILLLLIVLIVIAVIAVYFGQGRGKEAQR